MKRFEAAWQTLMGKLAVLFRGLVKAELRRMIERRRPQLREILTRQAEGVPFLKEVLLEAIPEIEAALVTFVEDLVEDDS